MKNTKTRNNKLFAPIALLVVAAWLSSCGGATEPVRPTARLTGQTPPAQTHAGIVVFMMTRCPHCADLMKTLIPLKKELGDALSLSFAYLGHLGPDGDPIMEAGDTESVFAQIQLCAGMNGEESRWLDFMGCIYGADAWRSLPTEWKACATQSGLDTTAIEQCLDEGEGLSQLRASIMLSAAEGVRAAPTVFIDGRQYLGDRSRGDLLAHFCYLAGEEDTRPPQCTEVAPPAVIRARLLVDSRCADLDECDVRREVDFLHVLAPTLDVSQVDYASQEGRELYDAIVAAGGPRTIPVMVFDKTIEAFPTTMARMGEYLFTFPDGHLMALARGWDPSAEICDNGTDDDGDTLADCDDEDCAKTRMCREKVPGAMDLFIMSQCPFGVGLFAPVDTFLDHMGRDRKAVNLRFQFIGEVQDGEMDSMHGPSEVEEDLRMICAQDLYGEDYRFMEYFRCRGKRYHSDDWESCVPKWMSKSKLEKCAQGDRGAALLKESFSLAQAVNATGSPTWMLNNKFEMEGRTPTAILAGFCERNESDKCGVEIQEPADPDPAPQESCR